MQESNVNISKHHDKYAESLNIDIGCNSDLDCDFDIKCHGDEFSNYIGNFCRCGKFKKSTEEEVDMINGMTTTTERRISQRTFTLDLRCGDFVW